jgi:hypothetical protein
MGRRWSCATSQGRHGSQPAAYLLSTSGGPLTSCEKQRIAIRMVCSSAGRVTVHGQGERGTAIWRVSPPPTPPHNVADLSEFVMANSFAATLRGGGHAPARERLRIRSGSRQLQMGNPSEVIRHLSSLIQES